MSYHVYFFRRQPGLSAKALYDILEEHCGNSEPPPGLLDDPGERRRIADSFLASKISLEEFRKDFGAIARDLGSSEEEARRLHGSIQLDVPARIEPPMQIEVSGSYFIVTIPLWNLHPARQQALQAAWSEILRIAHKFDFVGYDPQLDVECCDETFGKLTAFVQERTTPTPAPAAATLTKPTHKKPWWKLWGSG